MYFPNLKPLRSGMLENVTLATHYTSHKYKFKKFQLLLPLKLSPTRSNILMQDTVSALSRSFIVRAT